MRSLTTALSILTVGTLCVSPSLSAAPLKGSFALEGITYSDEPLFSEQQKSAVYLRASGDIKGQLALSASGDLKARYDFRFDSVDNHNFADAKTAALFWTKEAFQLRAGVLQERWGVMTTSSIADVFNQSDGVEDVDGSERLGQPGLAIDLVGESLDLSLLASPEGRERRLAENERRYRLLPVDYSDAVFEEGEDSFEAAARLGWRTTYFSLNMMHFRGHSREPEFVPVIENGALSAFTPTYKQIEQSAVTLEATLGNYVLRGEGIQRSGQTGGEFTAYSAGLERLLYGVGGASSDLLLYVEYFRDERTDSAPITLFNNDVSLGMQWIVNDQVGEVAGRVIYDLDTHSQLWILDYQQSLTDHAVFEATYRLPSNVEDDPALSSFVNDKELRLGVRWTF